MSSSKHPDRPPIDICIPDYLDRGNTPDGARDLAENELKVPSPVINALAFATRHFIFGNLHTEPEDLQRLRSYAELESPLFMAPKHSDDTDIIAIGTVLNSAGAGPARYIMKAEELADTEKSAKLLCKGGGIPIDRLYPGMFARLLSNMVKQTVEYDEMPLVWFPEGTRQPQDKVGDLFTGISTYAMKHSGLIVPAGIYGTEEGKKALKGLISKSSLKDIFTDPSLRKLREALGERPDVVVAIGDVIDLRKKGEHRGMNKRDITPMLKDRLIDVQARARDIHLSLFAA